MRIGRISRTLYLLDVGGLLDVGSSKFEVRFKARETEGSKRFEDAVQHCVKTAKMNVPVRNQPGVRNRIEERWGRIGLG